MAGRILNRRDLGKQAEQGKIPEAVAAEGTRAEVPPEKKAKAKAPAPAKEKKSWASRRRSKRLLLANHHP